MTDTGLFTASATPLDPDKPLRCSACSEPITVGQQYFVHERVKFPWLSPDHDLQEPDQFWWHRGCDGGSLAARGVLP